MAIRIIHVSNSVDVLSVAYSFFPFFGIFIRIPAQYLNMNHECNHLR